jgi:ABC-2 type transport system ATP-binding protein
MSIQVHNLTKYYHQQKAVDQISFKIQPGEIVGFLGPNGAGKSTTMKICTCFIPPSEGSAEVGGFDVVKHPMEVKRITGYLPEHNPLYQDLYVREYLQFVGGLYGLRAAKLKQRVDEMIDLCGLSREQHKKIEHLSKGYRQRVGLAQALIHDPQVLILDEPTSGLDPNQLVEIRKLVKDTSRDKTVIFSTHILQEVQALCDRIIVINRGQLVADDSRANLMLRASGFMAVAAEFESAVDVHLLQGVKGVKEVTALSKTSFRIIPEKGCDIRPELFRFAADQNLSLIGLKQEENSLEQIFRSLTSDVVEHSEK